MKNFVKRSSRKTLPQKARVSRRIRAFCRRKKKAAVPPCAGLPLLCKQEDHAAPPHGEADVQLVHPAHEGGERGRLHAALLPGHERLLLRRVGERFDAVFAARAFCARHAIDEDSAFWIGGDRLHASLGMLALDPFQSPERPRPERGGGCPAERRLLFERIPTREVAVEEQRQSRQDEQQEERAQTTLIWRCRR